MKQTSKSHHSALLRPSPDECEEFITLLSSEKAELEKTIIRDRGRAVALRFAFSGIENDIKAWEDRTVVINARIKQMQAYLADYQSQLNAAAQPKRQLNG